MKEALLIGSVLAMVGLVLYLNFIHVPTLICVLVSVVESISYALVVTRFAIFRRSAR